jgi:condensin complex subunit 2
MPKKDWKSKSRNLLPDDKHFNSRQLLRLFLKPKARLGSKRAGIGSGKTGFSQQNREDEIPEGEMDEAFWARNEGPTQAKDAEDDAPKGDYDANFFQDDGLAFPGGFDEDDGDMEFADARDHFSPGPQADQEDVAGITGVLTGAGSETQQIQGTEGAFGTQLVTQSRRLRPEYVQYARVAKKVDVRRLKEEIWKGMGIDQVCFLSNELFNILTMLCLAAHPSYYTERGGHFK